MSSIITGCALAEIIRKFNSKAVEECNSKEIFIKPENWLEIARFINESDSVKFDLLVSLTAVDYIDHFDVVYHFRSLYYNTFAIVKVRLLCFNRNIPSIDSVYSIWRGADYQEREVWDLLGINFKGHPNLKRIMLWHGFRGHPLRKDFITYEQSLVNQEQIDEDLKDVNN